MKNKTRINLKNNFKVKFDGLPNLKLDEVSSSGIIGVSPLNYNFLKAKVIVNIGDTVKQGQALFFDKKNPQVYFHSPISGIIKDIEYGPQRRLDLIKIEQNNKPAIKFSDLTLNKTSNIEFKSALLERGLWNGLIELPFYNIPSPDKIPPAIIIPLSHSEPFQPKLSTIIDNYEQDIINGIEWLKKLSPNISVFVDADEKINLDNISEHIKITRVNGDFASTSAGAFLYHMKSSAEENKAWICNWQHLVKISKTLSSNQYYNKALICLGGNQKKDNQHYLVQEGVALNDVFKLKNKKDRVICGGLFTGLHIENPSYLPLGIYAINVIDNDPKTEFLAFMQIGLEKPSFSRAYLSGVIGEATARLKDIPLPQFSELEYLTKTSTAVNGSDRDCVSCGFCEIVCPVDSLPQTLLRNAKVDDIEENMRLGLLDCSGCGACTYVCPSKIDLASTFINMKNNLYKELNA
tara:strand:- start:2510 stop:3901 length:1392 start_codon:yes stop_codon:yes gene_type:complete